MVGWANKNKMLEKLLHKLRYPKVKYYPELRSLDSGLVCLKMLVDYHKKDYPLEVIQAKCTNGSEPKSSQEIVDVGKQLYFSCYYFETLYVQLTEQLVPPVMIAWEHDKYVMYYGTQKNFWSFLPWVSKKEKIIIVDPKQGFMIIDEATFMYHWRREQGSRKGGVLRFLPEFESFITIPQGPPSYS
jgi:ATP-binding cassette, subfamily B, bacterial